MWPFLQRKPSPPAVLAAGIVAVGLALAVLYSVRTGLWSESGDADASSDNHTAKIPRTFHADAGSEESGTRERIATTGSAAENLLPRGIAEVEGAGGKGVHRAVLKNGVWFPVFSPGEALETDGSAAFAPRAVVPLSITSGSPPHGKTRVPLGYDFEAIGGMPPYRWSFRLGADATRFGMDASTGLFSGSSDVPLNTSLDVFVMDAAGAEDSAHYALVIEEESALAIATSELPAATMDSAYTARLEASGGVAPYLWTITGTDTAGLSLTANTGELTGTPADAGEFALQATVTDQAHTTITKTFAFTVTGTALRIVTHELPDATVGTAYSTQLTGEGGTAPYMWRLTGLAADGLSFDTVTGIVSGTPTTAGEFTLEATLTDQSGTSVTKSLTLTSINGLDITTISPLFPGSPGLPYQLALTATGGEAPYRWTVKEGALPRDAAGRPWTLSPEGVLSGVAAQAEGVFRFAIEVQDAADRTFTKSFDLPVRQALTAVPSKEKVGLAWRPDQIDAALRSTGTALVAVAVVRGVGSFPQTPAAGAIVYQGTGSNTVDHNLPTGGTFFYTLFVQSADGRVAPFSTAAAIVLPMTLLRGQPGVTGDPYADRVVAFQPLTPGGYGSAFVPTNITGPPDGKGTYAPASGQNEVASLHAKTSAGGSVTLEFTDNIVELGPGVDFTVFENVFYVGGNATQRFMEPALVWVALFDGQWYRFPVDVVPTANGKALTLTDPFYYNKGFAGRNGTTGADPTNPIVSGGDSFDANELAVPGLTWIRYIKILSTGDNAMLDDFGRDPVRHTSANGALSGGGTSGFDFDAVSAVNY